MTSPRARFHPNSPGAAVRNANPRSGFTLVELLAVLALLIILAAVTLPSFSGLQGNARQKAAADLLQARIADARGRAMAYGTEYRLAVHQDGARLRLAPDGPNFATQPADPDPSAGSARVSEDHLDRASAGLGTDPDADPTTAPAPAGNDGSGWHTIATFLPDGTCREDRVMIEVHETNFPPIRIQLRGVTGGARVLHPTANNGPGTGGGKP